MAGTSGDFIIFLPITGISRGNSRLGLGRLVCNSDYGMNVEV